MCALLLSLSKQYGEQPLLLVLDIKHQNLTKGTDFWHTIFNRQQYLKPKLVCIWVILKIVKDNVNERVARLTSITKRTPSRLDSSRTAVMPSIRFLLNQTFMLMHLGFINHIREFRYNDALTTRLSGFNLCTKTKDNGTLPVS